MKKNSYERILSIVTIKDGTIKTGGRINSILENNIILKKNYFLNYKFLFNIFKIL